MTSFARLLRVLLCVLLACFILGSLSADVKVKGYYRKDGTYVAPHTRSSPNKTKNDNYSTRGNINPYTGQAGTKPGDLASLPSEATKTIEAVATPSRFGELAPGMAPTQVIDLAGQPKMIRGSTWIYREGSVEFSASNRVSRVTASATSPTAPASNREVRPTAPQQQEKAFWVTNSSGVRHNSLCRYFQNTKGHAGSQNEGRACKICGG